MGFFRIFSIFFRIWLDWRALVKSHVPNIRKLREFFWQQKKEFVKFSDFLRRKKVDFLVELFDIFDFRFFDF